MTEPVLTQVDLMMDVSPFTELDGRDETPLRIIHIIQGRGGLFDVVMDGKKAAGLVFGEMLEEIVKLTVRESLNRIYPLDDREVIAAARAKHEAALAAARTAPRAPRGIIEARKDRGR